jgi:glycosyltransferase involved in cell wall biosynthesis
LISNNSDIRIGVSATILNRNDTLDGIGVYTQSLLREYQKLGLKPKAYTFPPVKKTGYELLPAGFKSIAVRSLMPFSAAKSMPLDIFHVTDYRAFPMSCPVVSTLYDAIPFVDPEMTNTHLRGLKNWMLKRSAHYADHVIAISNYSVAELVEHYEINPQKISVVHCGVDEDWLSTPPASLVSEVLKNRGLERGYFLNVGTIQPRKNLVRLMAAHDLLPEKLRKDFPLVVVGHAGWKCHEIIKGLRAKVHKGEAHWFNDVSSREELKCLFAGAGAFVFPSLYEGFGLPILEAFAIGAPVITSNTTSLPEVSMGIGLEVDPLSIDAITEAMIYVLQLSDREARVMAGKKRAAELSWRRCAEQTLSVYGKVINGIA